MTLVFQFQVRTLVELKYLTPDLKNRLRALYAQ